MNADIAEILKNWDYEPEHSIRILKVNSREVLQVRQPLGIEQYELDGRPDGKTFFGKSTILEEYVERLEDYKRIHNSDKGFKLTETDYELLKNEGILFYYRYLLLFQLGEYERTSEDTDHNIRISEFIEKYVDDPKEREDILQYKPYVLRINAISNAMISMQNKLKSVAKKILKSAIDLISTMPEINTPEFRFEKSRSLNYLKATIEQIDEEKEINEADSLKHELDAAVEREDYEQAAQLRDRIKELRNIKNQKQQSLR